MEQRNLCPVRRERIRHVINSCTIRHRWRSLEGRPRPRPACRRTVLVGRGHHRHLLPPPLPVPPRQARERALLRISGGGPGGRAEALPPLRPGRHGDRSRPAREL